MLLVKAIRILLADHIPESCLHLAEKLLKKFYKLYDEYYGALTFNIHNIIYLREDYYI